MQKTSKIISPSTQSKKQPHYRTIPRPASRSTPLELFIFPRMKMLTYGANSNTASEPASRVIVAGDPAVETLPRIEKFVKEYDIRIAIHNHGPEDKLWPSPLDVLKAVKNMDPRMGSCIDVGHAVRAGTDLVQAIQEAGPRLFNIHMKDLTNFHDKESQVAVGEGIVPVRKMFEALAAIQYQGFVDLEYEIHPDDPMPGVIASFSYMRGVLAAWDCGQIRPELSRTRNRSRLRRQRPRFAIEV